MPIPAMPSTARLYRPVGGSFVSEFPCRLVPAMWGGRARFPGGAGFQATHYADVPANTDIRDGWGRVSGTMSIVYADGDELRITVGGRIGRYAVTHVEDRYCNTIGEYRRAYLLRHSAGF